MATWKIQYVCTEIFKSQFKILQYVIVQIICNYLYLDVFNTSFIIIIITMFWRFTIFLWKREPFLRTAQKLKFCHTILFSFLWVSFNESRLVLKCKTSLLSFETYNLIKYQDFIMLQWYLLLMISNVGHYSSKIMRAVAYVR